MYKFFKEGKFKLYLARYADEHLKLTFSSWTLSKRKFSIRRKYKPYEKTEYNLKGYYHITYTDTLENDYVWERLV